MTAEAEIKSDQIVEVKNLKKYFTASDSGIIEGLFSGDRHIKAVDDVSFSIAEGEILGLAGQSGCGKSTLGELIAGLQKPTEGQILFKGEDVANFNKSELKAFRRSCQVIFQDPYESMNPRFSVARTVGEPLKIHDIGSREERDELIARALRDAGLDPPGQYLDKLPSELSGGERQRVLIARALVLDPDLLIADEPVSMLDVSIRTGILHLFRDLQERRDLTMLYVSHDLSTINYLTDKTMIMYLGNAVEIGPTQEVIHNPSHPYTEALIRSVPNADPHATRERGQSDGDVPDPKDLPSGCRYHPRCEYATDKCRDSEPILAARDGEGNRLDELRDSDNRATACYHPVESE